MTEFRRFNRHAVTHVPPDLVFVRFDGDVSTDEAHDISEYYSGKILGVDSRFVVDLTDLGAIGPGARKELAERRQEPLPGHTFVVDLAFVGANLRTKVLMTVIVAAGRMVSSTQVRTHFHGSLREASSWAGFDLGALER